MLSFIYHKNIFLSKEVSESAKTPRSPEPRNGLRGIVLLKEIGCRLYFNTFSLCV